MLLDRLPSACHTPHAKRLPVVLPLGVCVGALWDDEIPMEMLEISDCTVDHWPIHVCSLLEPP
jgi:hypothetical protein